MVQVTENIQLQRFHLKVVTFRNDCNAPKALMDYRGILFYLDFVDISDLLKCHFVSNDR